MLWHGGQAMTEAEWLECRDPRAMLSLANGGYDTFSGYHTSPGTGSARKLRLIACACARRVAQLLDGCDCGQLLRLADEAADAGGGPLSLDDHTSPREAVVALCDSADLYVANAAWALESFVWSDPYRAAENAVERVAALGFPPDLINRLTPRMARESPANPSCASCSATSSGTPSAPLPSLHRGARIQFSCLRVRCTSRASSARCRSSRMRSKM